MAENFRKKPLQETPWDRERPGLPVTQAIALIKPSGVEKSVGEHPLVEVFEAMLPATGLTIEKRTMKQFTEPEVRILYPNLNVPDEVHGDQWKIDKIAHMCAEPVPAYLISGKGAQEKLTTIKTHLRKQLAEEGKQGRIIANIMHVADEEDFDSSFGILFGESKQRPSEWYESLSPRERAEKLNEAKGTIMSRAKSAKPDFALLLYGSSVYGYNGEEYGNLDDLDGLGVAKRDITFDHIKNSLRGILDTTALYDEAMIEGSLHEFRRGALDLIRIPGKFAGEIPFSFHFLAEDAFRSGFLPSTVDKGYAARFPNTPKYYSGRSGYVMANGEYTATPEVYDHSEGDYTTVYQKFSPTTQEGDVIVGVLANKFLTSEVLYEPANMTVEATLNRHFRTFIRSALYFNPVITDEGIVGLLTRSERFSPDFKKGILGRIQNERAILQERKRNI